MGDISRGCKGRTEDAWEARGTRRIQCRARWKGKRHVLESEAPVWPVLGHDWAVALLRRSLAAGRVAHAYLFTGPPQIGKTTLARALAQALNCTGHKPPCGICVACSQVQRDVHPDVRIVQGEGAGENVKIDQVRAIQHEAMLAPYAGRYRVFIVRQMERATPDAANAMLKTLEEPPPQVVLILTAVHSDTLPRTVVSRCQQLNLRPVAPDKVRAALLEQHGTAPASAELLARLSGGRLGWALQAAKDENKLRERREGLDRLVPLLAATRVERLDAAQALSRDIPRLRQFLETSTAWWRDIALCVAADDEGQRSIINIDRLPEIQSVSAQLTLPQATAAIFTLQTTAAQIEANVNPRLALESALLSLPHLAVGAQDRR